MGEAQVIKHEQGIAFLKIICIEEMNTIYGRATAACASVMYFIHELLPVKHLKVISQYSKYIYIHQASKQGEIVALKGSLVNSPTSLQALDNLARCGMLYS